MNTERPRRQLRFRTCDEVIRDAELLAAGGYDKVGNWDLGQACGHLAEWARFPVDGFPRFPGPARLMLWVLRHTIGRRVLAWLLSAGAIPRGARTVPETIPAPGGDEAAAVERLRQALARLQAYEGKFKPSPLCGPLDREVWVRLHLLHCSHHLSFLIPRTR